MKRACLAVLVGLAVAACGSSPRADRPADTVAALPPTTTLSPQPTPTTLHPITGTVNAIGDSVMIDASSALPRGNPDDRDRRGSESIGDPRPAILASLAAEHQLGSEIVFGLAANGGVSAARINQVLRIAAGRRVVMVTGHCPHCRTMAAENDVIKANCIASRLCFVADWDALANKHPEWFASDGVHMGGPGARAYAHLIRMKL